MLNVRSADKTVGRFAEAHGRSQREADTLPLTVAAPLLHERRTGDLTCSFDYFHAGDLTAGAIDAHQNEPDKLTPDALYSVVTAVILALPGHHCSTLRAGEERVRLLPVGIPEPVHIRPVLLDDGADVVKRHALRAISISGT